MLIVLGLRGAAAVLVLTALVSGLPRVVQLGLAIGAGSWSAVLMAHAGAAVDANLVIAAREVVLGASLGVSAALPVLAAATAGRLVSATGRGREAYRALFAVLAAAVFVGVDGHVAVLEALARSFGDVPVAGTAPVAMAGSAPVAMATAQLGVIETLGRLLPSAVQLAIPWLVTAVVVEIAAGVALRLAGRAGAQLPVSAAVPAALVMMTASLVGTLAVAIAALVRG